MSLHAVVGMVARASLSSTICAQHQMKRLTREEIADVMNRGTRAHGLLCTYLSLPRTDPAISVVVSKKVAKTAVMRNRIKRRMRAGAQRVSLPKLAIVMVAKSPAVQATVTELTDDMNARLRREV